MPLGSRAALNSDVILPPQILYLQDSVLPWWEVTHSGYVQRCSWLTHVYLGTVCIEACDMIHHMGQKSECTSVIERWSLNSIVSSDNFMTSPQDSSSGDRERETPVKMSQFLHSPFQAAGARGNQVLPRGWCLLISGGSTAWLCVWRAQAQRLGQSEGCQVLDAL